MMEVLGVQRRSGGLLDLADRRTIFLYLKQDTGSSSQREEGLR